MFIKMYDDSQQVVFEGICDVIKTQPLTLQYFDAVRDVRLCFDLEKATIFHKSEDVVSKTTINNEGLSQLVLTTPFGEKQFRVIDVNYIYSQCLVTLGYSLYDADTLVGRYKFYFEMRY